MRLLQSNYENNKDCLDYTLFKISLQVLWIMRTNELKIPLYIFYTIKTHIFILR